MSPPTVVQTSVLAPVLAPLYVLLNLWSELLFLVARLTGLELLQY